MSFINKILEKLFGKNQQKAQPDNYMAGWGKKRKERIKTAEEQLSPWIIATVQEKGSLSFTWESGNDEAFVTFKDLDTEADNYEDLEMYVIDKLDIPDAGEFQMNGSGDIYIENNSVKVKYRSVMRELLDFDEETEQEIYGEGEENGGEMVLFAVN